MKIVIISDTHNQHEKLTIPKGDMIIHCGDVSGRGWYEEVRQFCNWFGELDFKYKIMIAGNHDFFFEGNLSTVKGTRSYYSQAEEKNEFEKKKALLFQSDIIYLENSEYSISFCVMASGVNPTLPVAIPIL